MKGIDAQIHDNLVNLDRIGVDSPAIGADIFPDSNGRGQRGAEHGQCFPDNCLRLERYPFHRGLPAEGQDLQDQVSGPVPGGKRLVQVLACGGVMRGVVPRNLGISQDHAEDIVEIMGNTAGEGSEGFKFLRPPDLFLQPQLFFFRLASLRDILGIGKIIPPTS